MWMWVETLPGVAPVPSGEMLWVKALDNRMGVGFVEAGGDVTGVGGLGQAWVRGACRIVGRCRG